MVAGRTLCGGRAAAAREAAARGSARGFSIVKAVRAAGARLAIAFIALTMLMPADNYEGRRISLIQFDPPGQPLPPAELNSLLPFKVGDALRMADVSAAIQRLYATGRYADVAVDASPAGDGVALRFITQPNYFIGGVTVEGAPDPPNAGQLVTAAKLPLGGEFSDNDLRQAIENMQNRLRENGFFRAEISDRVARDTTFDQALIHFAVQPGRRARFGGVAIEGRPEAPASALIRASGWRRFLGLGWQPVTENRVQNGLEKIRAYYQKHDRLMARVTISRMAYNEATNRVTPTLLVEAGPVVTVRTRGARVSRGKLKQLLPIYQEHSVDRSLLVEGQRNLTEYFQSQGYFDTEVDVQDLPVESNREIIEYTIERDGRHKLAEMTISGNRYFDDKTIRERMYIAPASFVRFRYGRYSRRYLDKDVDAIKDLYRSNGFRDVQIKTEVIDNYRGRKGEIAVKIYIDEGPQWLVNQVELAGVAESDRARLMEVIRSVPGQPYSEFNVAADRDNILSYFFNNGYPSASLDWSQAPAAAPYRMNLTFTITPGERRFVRDVVINGLKHTNPALVSERIDFGPGDPLSQAQIADAQRRLYDLGVFAKVQTAIQNPDGQEQAKRVLYDIEEARRWSTNVGFGAELGRIGGSLYSFDAPAGAAGFAPRISGGVSRLNFLGLGHTLSLQTRWSTLQQRALFSYFAPQFQGHERLNLTFTALYDNSRDVRTFAARRLEGSVQLSQRLSRANTIQYRFTYRDVFVDPNSLKITAQLIPILSQSVRVGLLSTAFIQDRRDDPTNAHKGVYNTVDLAYAARPFGSETSFGRLMLRDATYHPITRDLTFARSTIFGWIDRTGGLPDIPLPERIFSGGSSSHRGFPDNQAGPRDLVTGFPLGGTALLMNSFELRFPLIGDNVAGVLFHDAGNVYSSLRNISFRYHQRDIQDFDYMVQAFGFGIRYRTPIGPIRVDLALAPNSPRFVGFVGNQQTLLTCSAPGSATRCESSPQRINIFQFHFSLGQAF
jgi:outer membrane protein insertion porin family